MWTTCLRDDETGYNWGNEGKTAKMIARHRCSDYTFYDATIHDCGNWRFRAWCTNNTPHDWSVPYSDEGAAARGRGNRNNEALIQCREKGYAGINPHEWRDKGEWAYSIKCVNPGWIGDWDNSDGCTDNGQIRWKRRVDARGMDWNVAADWLINNNEVKQHNFSSVWKDHRPDSMWIMANRNDDPGRCRPSTLGGWVGGECTSDGKKEYKIGVDRKGYTQEKAAAFLIPYVKYKDQTGYATDSSTRITVAVDDPACLPSWKDDWKDDGCTNTGKRKWARSVNFNKWSPGSAGDWLRENKMTPKFPNNTGKNDDRGFFGGMWVITEVDDGTCVPTTSGGWVAKECTSDGKKEWKIKVEKREYTQTAAADIVKKNATLMSPHSVGSVYAVDSDANIAVTVDDPACKPTLGTWVEKKCNGGGTRNYEAKVNPEKYTMDKAVNYLKANSMGPYTYGERIDTPLNGTYIVGKKADGNCVPTTSGGWEQQPCDSNGQRQYKIKVERREVDAATAVNQLLLNVKYKGKTGMGTDDNKNIAVTVDDTACLPKWKDGSNWDKKDCKDGGIREYKREIGSTAYTKAPGVIAYLNTNLMSPYPAKSGYPTDNNTMMAVQVADSTCFAKPEGWSTTECTSPTTSTAWTKLTVPDGMDWLKSANDYSTNIVNKVVNGKRVVTATGRKDDSGAYSTVTFTDSTCNPGWLKDSSWKNDGCQADGLTRYSRQVDARGYDWEEAAKWMIANDANLREQGFITEKTTFYKDGSPPVIPATGIWIWGFKNNTGNDGCFVYTGEDTTNECVTIGNRRITKQCNNWPSGWIASQDVVNACTTKAPTGSTVKKFDTQVWAEWSKADATCNPGWLKDSSWKNDGCQADGLTRYSRQVDAKGLDWEKAAQWMIDNDANLRAQGFITEKTTFYKDGSPGIPATGIWIWGFKNNTGNDGCFVYNGKINNDGCTGLRKSTRAQQCNNWPNGWIASNDVVVACKKNAPTDSTVSINGAEVWAKWTADDADCVATPEGWSDAVCTPTNGYAKFWTKLSIPKGINWEKAGKDYTSTLTTVKDTRVSPVYREDTTGAYADAVFPNSTCVPKSFILKKPYAKNEDLGKNIEGIPSRFAEAITNVIPFI